MEWFYQNMGNFLVIAILAAVTVTILTNMFRKKGSPCGSCKGCSMDCGGCPGRQK